MIEDPFGKNGGPKYLGATTPVTGGSVEHLSLGMDGKLYADVLMNETLGGSGKIYKSLFVWDAANLIAEALNNNGKLTTPIDSGFVKPARYDGISAGQGFGWTYGIGTYTVPGRYVQLKTTQNTYPITETTSSGQAASVEDNVYTQALGITDKQVQADIIAGNTGALSAVSYASKVLLYDGWNFFTAGFVGRQAVRYQAVADGKLSDGNYITASLIDSVTSVASIALAGRIGVGATGGLWGEVAAGAKAGATFSIVQQAGEIGTYAATNGQSGKSLSSASITELATSTIAGAGLSVIGSVMSRIPKANYKIVWNSPTASNPSLFKLEEPIASTKGSMLLGSMADTTSNGALRNAGGTIITPSTIVVTLPEQQSLTATEAAQWLSEQGALIPKMLNKSASLQEQAFEAAELENILTTAARNAMQDANAAAQLSMTDPALTYQELVHAEAKDYAGSALYKKVINDAVDAIKLRTVANPGGCFIAGTLVHTKDGLKPIEQISVGDWVLSQPEEKGELAYKRVNQTFVYKNKEIFIVQYHKDEPNDDDTIIEAIGVTGNHPFWVKDVGWTRADILKTGDRLELHDGSNVRVICAVPLLKTHEEKVGWARGAWGVLLNDYSGHKVDLQQDSITVEIGSSYVNWDAVEIEQDNPYYYYKSQVFNLEIEGFHTYYVGEMGVWVHNQNCEGVKFVDAKIDLVPSPGTEVYVLPPNTSLNLPGPNKGVVLVLERKGAQPITRGAFEEATQGALRNKDGEAVPWSLRYDNNVTFGVDYIKLGDGRVIVDGKFTNTFIDAKSGVTPFGGDVSGSFFKKFIESDLRQSFQRLAKALQDNLGYSQILEFEAPVAGEVESAGFTQAKTFFAQEVKNDMGWYSQKIMIRMRGQDQVTVFEKNANGDVVEKLITPTFTFADEPGSPLADVANKFIKAQTQKLTVDAVGNVQGNSLLTQADIAQLLPSARQYWLNAGASAAVLDATQITIGNLPAGVAGQTQGNQITLSADGAGWGWFVDPTPMDSLEFINTSSSQLIAPADSAASGKLDLLTVLIHELGHRLGLAHDGTGAMEAILQAGQRDLPSAAEIALISTQIIRNSITTQPLTTLAALPPQFETIANPTLASLTISPSASSRQAIGWISDNMTGFCPKLTEV